MPRRVVIIGGGVSGLSAAKSLCQSGNFDVTILEAENRLGGRVHSVEHRGAKMELGAQWIHGKDGNAVYELLSKQLPPSDFIFEDDERYLTDDDTDVMFTSGRKMSDEAQRMFYESTELPELVELEIEKLLDSGHVTENDIKLRTVKSVAEAVWEKKFLVDSTLTKPEMDAILENNYTMMAHIDGLPPESISCLSYYYYEEIDTDVILRDSNSILIDVLRKDIPNSAIKLNCKVQEIKWQATQEREQKPNSPFILDLDKSKPENVNSNRKENPILDVNHKTSLERIQKLNSSAQYTNDTSGSKYLERHLPQSMNVTHEDKECSKPIPASPGYNGSKDSTNKDFSDNQSQLNELCRIANGQHSTTKLNQEPGTRSAPAQKSVKDSDLSDTTSSEKAINCPVTVTYLNENGNQTSITADHVILTVSLGVLKKYHKTLIQPNLPTEKQECLEKMAYGTVEKVIFCYADKFWDDDDDFLLYFLWDSKCDSPILNDNPWCREINSVESWKDNFLVLWLSKSASKKIKKVPKFKIWKAIHDLARQYDSDLIIPQPDDIIMTKWSDNDNFLGCYSATGIGETLETKQMMRRPLMVGNEPKVFFAGEAMHETRFSTVDGAYLTGVEAAESLINHYNSVSPTSK